MSDIVIAVIGPARSGKSTLTEQLNAFYSLRGDGIVLRDVGDQVPEDLWRECDYVIVTFDLSITGRRVDLDGVCALASDAIAQGYTIQRVCIVGTKWDQISPNFVDTAIMVYGHAREAAWKLPGLKLFPVSSVTRTGYPELSRHIAEAFRPPKERRQFLQEAYTGLCSAGTWVLDQLARVLTLPVPHDVNCSTPDILELDDSTVEELLDSPESYEWDATIAKSNGLLNASTTHRITPDLLVKGKNPAELAAMHYVRAHTRIPVPQPRYSHLRDWLVMDLIDGTTLHDCWSSLSWWMQLRVACTLRLYVRQLRALKGTRPGPLVDGMFKWHPLFDGTPVGPFKDSTTFRIWCERVAHCGWVDSAEILRRHGLPEEIKPYPVMDREWPLVFTHGDLHLQNIILSKNGILYVIDWASGGFFPPWLETVGLVTPGLITPPSSFQRYMRFISGSFPEYEMFWGFFMSEVHRWDCTFGL